MNTQELLSRRLQRGSYDSVGGVEAEILGIGNEVKVFWDDVLAYTYVHENMKDVDIEPVIFASWSRRGQSATRSRRRRTIDIKPIGKMTNSLKLKLPFSSLNRWNGDVMRCVLHFHYFIPTSKSIL